MEITKKKKIEIGKHTAEYICIRLTESAVSIQWFKLALDEWTLNVFSFIRQRET